MEVSQHAAVCLVFAYPEQPTCVPAFLAGVDSSPVKFLLGKFLKSKLIPQQPSFHVPSLALGSHVLAHPSLEMKGLQFFCGSDLEEEPHLDGHDSSQYPVRCRTAEHPACTCGCLHVS